MFIKLIVLGLFAFASVGRAGVTIRPMSPTDQPYLTSLGVKGKILEDSEFNGEGRRPVPLPGVLLESIPDEQVWPHNHGLSELVANPMAYRILLQEDSRGLIRQILNNGTLLIISTNVCDEKGHAAATGIGFLKRWEDALERPIHSAVLVSYCASFHTLAHEYFHTFQHRENLVGKKPSTISLQELARATLNAIGLKEIPEKDPNPLAPDFFRNFVYAFIEAQACLFSIEYIRELYPDGKFPVPSYYGAELFMMDYMAEQYRQMIIAMNRLSAGNKEKSQRIFNLVQEKFSLGNSDFLTGPLGWNRFACLNSKGLGFDVEGWDKVFGPDPKLVLAPAPRLRKCSYD